MNHEGNRESREFTRIPEFYGTVIPLVRWMVGGAEGGRLVCRLGGANPSNHPPYGASGLEVNGRLFGRKRCRPEDRESSGVWFGGSPKADAPQGFFILHGIRVYDKALPFGHRVHSWLKLQGLPGERVCAGNPSMVLR